MLLFYRVGIGNYFKNLANEGVGELLDETLLHYLLMDN